MKQEKFVFDLFYFYSNVSIVVVSLQTKVKIFLFQNN